MRRYGWGTRLAMLVLGAAWIAAGLFWLYHLDPSSLSGKRGAALPFVIALGLLCGGVCLLHGGLMPARRKTFEEEKPDLNPSMGDEWWHGD